MPKAKDPRHDAPPARGLRPADARRLRHAGGSGAHVRIRTCRPRPHGADVEEGLEFYHDQAGLSVGRAATVEAVKNNVCNNFTRQLLPGTLEVWPVPGYGAIETGLHTFTNVGADAPHGIARFLHVWHQEGDTWRISRIVSYDNGPYTPPAKAD